MYWVYILISLKDCGYYTGSTGDINYRLKRHFSGRSRTTKNRRPLKLVYKSGFSSKSAAIRHEQEIKRHKSKKYIEKIIRNKMGR